MTERTYTAAELVGFAAGDNVADFQAAFNQMATARAAQEVEKAREYVGTTFASGPEDEETPEDQLNDLEELEDEDDDDAGTENQS